MAAELLLALEPTLTGGSITIPIPARWAGKKRSPHTYAHGNLSKHVKAKWPEYGLKTRVNGGDLTMWLEKRKER